MINYNIYVFLVIVITIAVIRACYIIFFLSLLSF